MDKIELYMGPTQLGAPDDLKQVIVSFIDGARKKLDIAVQELDCRPYYADDEITLQLLFVNLAIHAVLFATVLVLVWASKQGKVVAT